MTAQDMPPAEAKGRLRRMRDNLAGARGAALRQDRRALDWALDTVATQAAEIERLRRLTP